MPLPSPLPQFVIDLCIVYFASYAHWAHKYKFAWLPQFGDCAGKEYAAVAGMVCLTS